MLPESNYNHTGKHSNYGDQMLVLEFTRLAHVITGWHIVALGD